MCGDKSAIMPLPSCSGDSSGIHFCTGLAHDADTHTCADCPVEWKGSTECLGMWIIKYEDYLGSGAAVTGSGEMGGASAPLGEPPVGAEVGR